MPAWTNLADKDRPHGWPEEPCGEYSDPCYGTEELEEMRRWNRRLLIIMTPILAGLGIAVGIALYEAWR